MTNTHTATRRLRCERGTTLIETSIAIGILMVVLAGLMSATSVATTITENEGHLSARAAEYAQDKMEQLLALAYGDAISDTTCIPTCEAGGTGLAVGGNTNTAAPVAQYFDYLDRSGDPLCPCVGTDAPDDWFYMRVWQISIPAGKVNLKMVTVTSTVASGLGRTIVPRATMTSLKSSPF